MVNFDYNSDCWTTRSVIGLNSSHVWGNKTSFSQDLLLIGTPLKELVNEDEEDGIEEARKGLDAAYNKEENYGDDEDELDELDDDEEDFDDEDFDEEDFDDEDFDDEE